MLKREEISAEGQLESLLWLGDPRRGFGAQVQLTETRFCAVPVPNWLEQLFTYFAPEMPRLSRLGVCNVALRHNAEPATRPFRKRQASQDSIGSQDDSAQDGRWVSNSLPAGPL